LKRGRSARVFVADVMLGRLAGWLRLLGFKTVYAGDFTEDDDETIKLALQRKATLLTRDKKLFAKARDYVPCVLVRSNDYATQLKEFAHAFKMRLPKDVPQTLCPKCGGALKNVPKQSVKGEVFPRVFSRNKAFWRCVDCGQLYWRGTHVKEIKKLLRSIASS